MPELLSVAPPLVLDQKSASPFSKSESEKREKNPSELVVEYVSAYEQLVASGKEKKQPPVAVINVLNTYIMTGEEKSLCTRIFDAAKFTQTDKERLRSSLKLLAEWISNFINVLDIYNDKATSGEDFGDDQLFELASFNQSLAKFLAESALEKKTDKSRRALRFVTLFHAIAKKGGIDEGSIKAELAGARAHSAVIISLVKNGLMPVLLDHKDKYEVLEVDAKLGIDLAAVNNDGEIYFLSVKGSVDWEQPGFQHSYYESPEKTLRLDAERMVFLAKVIKFLEKSLNDGLIAEEHKAKVQNAIQQKKYHQMELTIPTSQKSLDALGNFTRPEYSQQVVSFLH